MYFTSIFKALMEILDNVMTIKYILPDLFIVQIHSSTCFTVCDPVWLYWGRAIVQSICCTETILVQPLWVTTKCRCTVMSVLFWLSIVSRYHFCMDSLDTTTWITPWTCYWVFHWYKLRFYFVVIYGGRLFFGSN